MNTRIMFDRMDPVVMGVIGAVLLITGVIVLGLSLGSVEDSFRESCIQKGGVPLIAHSGTKICIKSDLLLSVN